MQHKKFIVVLGFVASTCSWPVATAQQSPGILYAPVTSDDEEEDPDQWTEAFLLLLQGMCTVLTCPLDNVQGMRADQLAQQWIAVYASEGIRPGMTEQEREAAISRVLAAYSKTLGDPGVLQGNVRAEFLETLDGILSDLRSE